ncbi:glycosyltransferase [Cellulomonas sp. NPDC055163]
MTGETTAPRATERPRVALFRHNLFVPSETFIRAQAARLDRYEPWFVARRDPHHVPAGARVASVFGRGDAAADAVYGLTARSRRLDSVLAGIAPALVHAHFGPDGLYARSAARRLGLPLVVTLHGRDATVRGEQFVRTLRPVGVRYGLGRRRFAGTVDLTLCVSDGIRRAAIAMGSDPARTVTHYIGVDTHELPVADGPRSRRVVHVARLVEKKGTSDLVTAVARLRSAGRDVELEVIGDGPLRAELERHSAALGVEQHVRFLGQLPRAEVIERVGRAGAFALPSVTASDGDTEGLPIALLEAMSLGVAVVATQHSGIPEAVVHGETGLLVPEHDPAALADALWALLGDEASALELGRAGASRVRAHFDLTAQTARLEDLYDTLVGGTPSGRGTTDRGA